MVTTHYMDKAQHCQNLVFIKHGRLVALGSPAAIKESKVRGQVLEIACSDPARAIPALRKMGMLDEVALYGSLIHVVAPDVESLKPQIEEALQHSGVGVRVMDLIAPSLEDVFISSVRAP